MDTRPVRQCARSGDRCIKRVGKVEAIRHKVIEWSQLSEVIPCEKSRVMNIKLRDQAAQRGYTITLADTHHRDIKTVRASLQRRDGISDGAPGVIMPVKLNANAWIAFNTKTDELFNLARCGDADGVG